MQDEGGAIQANTNGYTIHVAQAQQFVAQTTQLNSSTSSTTSDVASSTLNPSAFAGIGTTVGSTNDQMHQSLIDSLNQTQQVLQRATDNINAAIANYVAADNDVAASYARTQADATQEAAQLAATVDMTTDLTLRSQLETDEGRKKHVYTDTQGHPTVGVGVNLDRKGARERLTDVGADYDKVRAGKQDLTDAQIDQLLSQDIGTAKTTASNYYDGFDQLDPARQRVLTNMAFNMGSGTLGQFQDLHTALENGNYDAAADAMQDSAWANQTGPRATRLINTMRTGQ